MFLYKPQAPQNLDLSLEASYPVHIYQIFSRNRKTLKNFKHHKYVYELAFISQ